MQFKRGDVIFVKLPYGMGSEQGGTRPAVVIQNDIGNRFSPTTIVAFFTTKDKVKLPTHVEVDPIGGLTEDSTLMLEQLRTIDKHRILEKIGELGTEAIEQINQALIISLGLGGGDTNVGKSKKLANHLSYYANTADSCRSNGR